MIPEDVRVAANMAFNSKYSNGSVDIYGAIESAIMTERRRCAEIATAELNNIGTLLSSPPKSAAAWEIRNSINSGAQP